MNLKLVSKISLEYSSLLLYFKILMAKNRRMILCDKYSLLPSFRS